MIASISRNQKPMPAILNASQDQLYASLVRPSIKSLELASSIFLVKNAAKPFVGNVTTNA